MMPIFANVIWGARCGKSARRVLLGETRSRDYAYSVRRRRESARTRQAPHGLPSSRLVSTILFDLWFAEEVRPRLRGNATFIRFADDGIFGFERQDDAQRVLAVLSKRMEHFGLTLHPEKTQLLDFRRPSTVARRRPESDDVRLPRVLLVLAANSCGKLGSGVQDPACEVGAGHTTSVCRVLRQSTPTGPSAARGAQETSAGPY